MDKKKRNIVIALMVAMFLGAVEGTVVTTATPTIVKDLNGFEMISWVFSLYLLTSAISTPIYGKLSDLYGRKNVLSVGIVIFLIGSALCGFAQNMYQLIAFRALQGLGAGAIFTVTYTIVGDIFTLAERAKVQGWISSVWGIASLAGPFIGGFFIDTLTWNWIFFINIPFGILCIILLQKNLQENFERKKHRIDYAGTLALSAAIIVLLVGVVSGERSSTHSVISVLASILAAIVLLIVFYFIERKAEEPIVPFEIFTKTNIMINIISFLASAVLIGVDVYMPLYIQNVLGYKATISGLVLAPMSVSWILSSVILGKLISRIGERIILILSATVLAGSCALLPTLGVQSSLALVILYVFIMGFGFGGVLTTVTIVVQSSVDYTKRGAATASNSLLRTIGQTIGVSIFGSLLNFNIVEYFNKLGIMNIDPDSLYHSSGAGVSIPLEQIKGSLNAALQVVFVLFIVLAVACLTFAFTIPNTLKGVGDSKADA